MCNASIMDTLSISDVLAGNLKYWMRDRQFVNKTGELNQSKLARASGVAQKTVSNYLNPKQRDPKISGEKGAPNLSKIMMLAKALNIPVWLLLRPLD